MPAPTYPPVDLAALAATELAALGDYFRTAADAVVAEQARRQGIADRARRAAAYRFVDERGDDPRWTPQAWDGARICAGPYRGKTGFIVGVCPPGVCCPDDGQPRWRVKVTAVDLLITCVPRAHLRPVPTVRRPGSVGRDRCDYACRCCMGDPSRRLEVAGDGRR